MPDDAALATDEERRAAFQAVIYVYSLISVATAVLVWFVIPEPDHEPVDKLSAILSKACSK